MDRVAEYLGKTVRVNLSDGRIIEGEFLCLDKSFNFVIGSAIEYHPHQSEVNESKWFSRSIGLAIVPGNHIVKCLTKTES